MGVKRFIIMFAMSQFGMAYAQAPENNNLRSAVVTPEQPVLPAHVNPNAPIAPIPNVAQPIPGLGVPLVQNPPNIPNISNGQNRNQAMQVLQQFMQLFSGPKGAPPMYLPDGSVNPEWQRANQGRPDAPYYGRSGPPEYTKSFPGLEQAPNLSPTEAAKRLKGHKCSPNDKDRLACMVCNLMYEAGNEPEVGQRAVARSVMTRAFSSKYPDTVCKVVYQNNGKVAQYSWTFEKKDHTLPHSDKVDKLIKVAMESMQQGPNGLTNYFAWNLVNPSWGNTGECALTSTRIYNHQFCRINGDTKRTVAEYLRAEGIAPNATPVKNLATTAD